MQENGQPAMETTDIPQSRRRQVDSTLSSGSVLEEEEDTINTSNANSTSASNNQSQQQVQKAESRLRKIVTRALSGAGLIGLFVGTTYAGHLYICLLVALVELLLVSTE